jgi:hypothetical protein
MGDFSTAVCVALAYEVVGQAEIAPLSSVRGTASPADEAVQMQLSRFRPAPIMSQAMGAVLMSAVELRDEVPPPLVAGEWLRRQWEERRRYQESGRAYVASQGVAEGKPGVVHGVGGRCWRGRAITRVLRTGCCRKRRRR